LASFNEKYGLGALIKRNDSLQTVNPNTIVFYMPSVGQTKMIPYILDHIGSIHVYHNHINFNNEKESMHYWELLF
jgi:hypothetical protein